MKTIIVTGTPGTGKTTFSKKLAKDKDYSYIDVNEFIKENKLSEGYDRRRKCLIVDDKKLARNLEKMIKSMRENKQRKSVPKGIVIDSHMSHYIQPEHADMCIVTRCELKELEKRLKKKGYSRSKIDENMECEIMDMILTEAKELGHNVKVIRTDKKSIKTSKKSKRK